MKLIHSIGAKVLVLTGFAVLVALVVGLSGREAVVGLHSTVKELGILQQGLHNQSEADGANHALQYDVLAAVTATSADERKERLDDLAERYEQLEGLAVTRRLLLGLDDNPADKEKLRQAFAEVDAALKAYVDAARAVEDALAHDPGAAAGRLQAVDAAQVVFDERFDALTSAINAYADSIKAETTAYARGDERRMVMLLLFAVVIPGFGLMIRRSINRNVNQTSQILAVVDAAAAGDLTRDQRGCHPDAECRGEPGWRGRRASAPRQRLRRLAVAATGRRPGGLTNARLSTRCRR